MTDQVPAQVTELPVKPSALKRWSKRAVVAAVAVTAVALVSARLAGKTEESDTEHTGSTETSPQV